MDSVQHLEYLYHKAMCQRRRMAPPSPPPSTDSGFVVNDNDNGKVWFSVCAMVELEEA